MSSEVGKLLWVSGEPAPGGLTARYACAAAADAAQALDRVGDTHPEVMLADLELLGGQAMELIARAKALEPALMVLLLTAHPDGEEVRRAEAAQSVVRVIAKPPDPRRLEQWVDNSLKLSRLRQANEQLRQVRRDLGRAKTAPVLRVVVLEPSALTQLSVAPGGPAGPRQVELSWTEDPNRFLAMVALAADLAIVDLELAGGSPTEWVLKTRMAPGRSRLPLILLGKGEVMLSEPRTVALKKPIAFEQVLSRIGSLAAQVEAGR